MKVVIVGGVAGGASAAARLRRLDEHAEIIIFERGEHISFANCGLPYYIGGDIKSKSALLLQTPESFGTRFNIDVRVQSEVIEIDPQSRTVTVFDKASGTEYCESYTKLILAPGAEPILPPVKGLDSDKVFTLRTIPDSERIVEYINAKNPKSALVVGGGFIGVEMAENLMHLGLEVTIAELSDQLMPPLDFEMASDLHLYAEARGIKLALGRAVTEITETNAGLEIKAGDCLIKADMLIMAAGVKPDTRLAEAAGIPLNKRGSILTDKHMRTSVRDIYAVGDAAESMDFVTGEPAFVPLAGPANRQGRIAADNICGIESEYEGTQGSAVVKFFDMTVASTGINEKTAKKLGINYDKVYTYSASHASYYPGAENMSVKIIFQKESGKLLGAQIVDRKSVV